MVVMAVGVVVVAEFAMVVTIVVLMVVLVTGVLAMTFVG